MKSLPQVPQGEFLAGIQGRGKDLDAFPAWAIGFSPFTAVPTSRMTRFEVQLFSVILCRRLHLPSPCPHAPAHLEIVHALAQDDVAPIPRGGLIGKEKLVARFDKFAAGQWHEIVATIKCSEDAAVVSRRHCRRGCPNTMENRAARAQPLVQFGVLLSGRHALEGAVFAPGNTATLEE